MKTNNKPNNLLSLLLIVVASVAVSYGLWLWNGGPWRVNVWMVCTAPAFVFFYLIFREWRKHRRWEKARQIHDYTIRETMPEFGELMPDIPPVTFKRQAFPDPLTPKATAYRYWCPQCGTQLSEGPSGGCDTNAVCRKCHVNWGCLPDWAIPHEEEMALRRQYPRK